jgi:hypothetical protein
VNKANFGKLAAGKTQGVEWTVESKQPQGKGENLVAQLDSAVNQAEQLRDEQVQQQYSDQLGVYVQEKAEQIDRLQSSLAAALTSEQAQLQAIQQRAPSWTAGKKAHAQWEQQIARRKTRIAQPYTSPVCPERVRRSAPLLASQTLSVLSAEADTMKLPSGLIAQPTTESVCQKPERA